MFYRNIYNRLNPGLIIFLIDQSATTNVPYFNGELLNEMFAKIVNKSIESIFIKSSFGDTVKDLCFIEIMGYGPDNVKCIASGPISYFEKYIDNLFLNHKNYSESNHTLFNVVEPTSEGFVDVLDGFLQAEQVLIGWKKNTIYKEYTNDHVPIIIHIGTGVLCNEQVFRAIDRINKIEFNDGNPIVINFIYNPWSMQNESFEYFSQSASYKSEQNYLFQMSSFVHKNLGANYETCKLFQEHPEYKFLFVNSKITPAELLLNIFDAGSSSNMDKIC